MDEKKKAAHVKASMRYNAKNVKQIKLNLNYNTDQDIIDKLSSVGNKQGYLKSLVRRDLNQ